MRLIRTLGAILVFGLSVALASPAQDLYDQATFYLETQYFGPSSVNISTLIQKYQAEVDKACASQKDTCTYEKVEPLLEQMFGEIQDDHTYYESAAAVADEQAQLSGNPQSPTPRVGFTHVGFIERDGQKVEFGQFTPELFDALKSNAVKPISNDRLIISVLPNSPGEKAGLRAGDRWIGFNTTLFASLATPQDVAQALADFTKRVQAGETLKMLIVRGADRQRLEVTIKGEIVSLLNLPTLNVQPNGVAILRLPDFLIQGVGTRVHALVKEAQDKGAKAIVLDMRGNGGGLGDERAIAGGAFIQNPEPMRRVPRYNAAANTIEEVYKDGRFIQRDLQGHELSSQVVQNPALWTGPLVVLVDSGCASACEYMAAYIQRAKRGPVIGEPTVGIGNTNSNRFGLINGGAAAMPTLRAYWSDGTLLPTRIQPDVAVPNDAYQIFDTGRDLGFDKALETLKIQ